MRVLPLHRASDNDYSCVSYWILGDRNEEADRNSLIDTGSKAAENSAFFLAEMAKLSKGIGKIAVEQIILTHDHSDHSGGLAVLDRQFAPAIYSWLPTSGRHIAVHDNMHLTLGDQDAFLLRTPGHSEDSICIYVPCTRTLFSGDSVYRIDDNRGSYSRAYLESLERLAALDIETIYPGHGPPIFVGAAGFLESCVGFVRASPITGP